MKKTAQENQKETKRGKSNTTINQDMVPTKRKSEMGGKMDEEVNPFNENLTKKSSFFFKDLESELINTTTTIVEELSSNISNNFEIEEIYKSSDALKLTNPEIFEEIIKSHGILKNYKKKIIILKVYSREFSEKKSSHSNIRSNIYEPDVPFFIICINKWAKLNYIRETHIEVFGIIKAKSRSVLISECHETEKLSEMNFLIVSPERAIKVTHLTGEERDCRRFEQLNIIHSIHQPQNKFGLDGTIQHDLFEEILQMNYIDINEERIDGIIREKMANYISDIYLIKKDLAYNEEFFKLKGVCKRIIEFKQMFLIEKQTLSSVILKGVEYNIKVLDVEATEKKYISGSLGLVGVIDTILNCRLTTLDNKESIDLLVPFELKTGTKIKEGYKWQVMVYNLMMREKEEKREERFDNGFGIVYYSNVDVEEDGELKENPIITILEPYVLIDLFYSRNIIIENEIKFKLDVEKLSDFKLSNRTENPSQDCYFCPTKEFCITYDVFRGTFKEDEVIDEFGEFIKEKIKEKAIDYPSVSNAIMKEQSQMKKLKSDKRGFVDIDFPDSFAEDSSQKMIEEGKDKESGLDEEIMIDFDEIDAILKANKREKLENLKLPDIEDLVSDKYPEVPKMKDIMKNLDLEKIKYFAKWMDILFLEDLAYSKEKKKIKSDDKYIELELYNIEEIEEVLSAFNNYQTGNLKKYTTLIFEHWSDPESTSIQEMANFKVGSKVRLNKFEFDIGLSGVIKLKKMKNPSNLNKIRWTLKIEFSSYHLYKQLKKGFEETKFNRDRLEKDWFFEKVNYNFSSTLKGSIIQLITDEKYENLAEIMIRGRTPKLLKKPDLSSKFETVIQAAYPKKLNKDQEKAIDIAFRTDSFSLILGMPGTGKTRTISIMLDIMAKLEKKVLVMCYTHNALDNVIQTFLTMYKIRQAESVRISSSKGNKSDLINSITMNKRDLRDFRDIDKIFKEKKIYFNTVQSTRDPLLHVKKFDYVIIDESSQMIEPKMIQALNLGEKFILVGDYFQLSPIIKSNDSELKGAGVSLFERLCVSFRGVLSELTIQVNLTYFLILICFF